MQAHGGVGSTWSGVLEVGAVSLSRGGTDSQLWCLYLPQKEVESRASWQEPSGSHHVVFIPQALRSSSQAYRSHLILIDAISSQHLLITTVLYIPNNTYFLKCSFSFYRLIQNTKNLVYIEAGAFRNLPRLKYLWEFFLFEQLGREIGYLMKIKNS